MRRQKVCAFRVDFETQQYMRCSQFDNKSLKAFKESRFVARAWNSQSLTSLNWENGAYQLIVVHAKSKAMVMTI